MKAPTVWRPNGSKIMLKDGDWLGSGGEGSVWNISAHEVLKLSLEPQHFFAKTAKMSLLFKVQHPSLITPTDLALDAQGHAIGYFMKKAHGEPLARFFSPAWQAKQGFSLTDIELLTERIRLTLEALHQEKIIGGDINEFNWSVHQLEPFLFDCDSWGIGSYPVNAMLPSIADPLVKQHYTQDSDWFAFAILAFQLFVGVHPFRGSHPQFQRQDFQLRMQKGVSLFDPLSSAPKSARELSAIPPGLKRWIEQVLSHQTRQPAPPKSLWHQGAGHLSALPVSKATPAPADTLKLKVSEQWSLPSPFEQWIGMGLALLQDGRVLDLTTRSILTPSFKPTFGIRLAQGSVAWISWDQASGLLKAQSETLVAQLSVGLDAQLFFDQGRLFVLKEQSWQELSLKSLGKTLLLVSSASAGLYLKNARRQDGGYLIPTLGRYSLLRAGPQPGKGFQTVASPSELTLSSWPQPTLHSSVSCPGLDFFNYRDATGAEHSFCNAPHSSVASPNMSLALQQHSHSVKLSSSLSSGWQHHDELVQMAFSLAPEHYWIIFGSGHSIYLHPKGISKGPDPDFRWCEAHCFMGSLWQVTTDLFSLEKATLQA